MRRSDYFKRASKRFLEGTRCTCPCDAVESGRRTLEQWAAILSEERDIELRYQEAHRQSKPRKVVRRIQTSNGQDFAAA
jgi:hypothetical protein